MANKYFGIGDIENQTKGPKSGGPEEDIEKCQKTISFTSEEEMEEQSLLAWESFWHEFESKIIKYKS